MSKIGVSLKVNVSKIEKQRLFHGKNGNIYLDATVFIDLNELDQYGNSGMITQDVSKEEKLQNVKGNILGNCKVFWNDAGQQAPQQQAPQQQPQGGFGQQQAARQATNQAVQQNVQQGQQQAPQFDDDLPF